MTSRFSFLFAVAAVVSISASACTADDVHDEHLGQIRQPLTSGFRLPFKCAMTMPVTQGNNSGFSHTGEAAYGFDFGVPLNTQLVAAKAGKVTFARNDVKPGNPCYSGGGSGCVSTLNYVTIDHGDGTSTLYAHMNSVTVTVGQIVTQGQPIGLSGGTGWSTGPHTHLQRQVNCGIFTCQSIAMSFDDVAGNGVPVAGQTVKSANACADIDCALGDGYYCGGNGVKGDKATLFLCKAGVPTVVEKCAYGCAPMPPGIEDRCATAAEAPDGGADAGDGAQPTAPASDDGSASTDPSAQPDDPTNRERPELPALDDGSAASCSTTHAMPSRASGAWLVVAWIAALAGRRGRAARRRSPR
jgi:hypothetical protein